MTAQLEAARDTLEAGGDLDDLSDDRIFAGLRFADADELALNPGLATAGRTVNYETKFGRENRSTR